MNEEVARLYATVGVKISDALSGLRSFRTRLLGAQSGLKTLRDQSKITGAALTALLAAPMALLGKTAIDMVADYQKSMAVFQLVTKASADEMTKAQAAIEAVAHDLSLPQFTKADAAEALMRLGQAGLGATGSMLALHPALLLAAAGEVSAKEGADLLANTLNAFKMPASQAGTAADILAATMKNSGLSMTDIAQAVQNAGAAFQAAGVPLDVFGTMLAQLGKAGYSGAVASTTLRNVIQSMASPTEEQAALFRTLGVQIYDAQGQMRPFRDILGQLHDGFARLTPALQAQRAEQLFGNDAIGAALTLIRGGLPEYDAMHEKVTQVGIAQEIASVKADTLGGATANLTKEMQNAASSAIEPMSKDLADLAHGAADAMRAFQQLPAPVREAVGVAMLLLPVLVGLQLVFTALAPLITAILSPIGLAAIGIAALVVVVINIHDWLTKLSDAFEHLAGVRVDFEQMFKGIPILGDLIRAAEALRALGLLPGGGPYGGNVILVGGGGAPAMARGGPVASGRAYTVGERGPELFVPGSSGTIVPNAGAVAGGDATTVVFNAPVYGWDDFETAVVRANDLARRRSRA